jgi:hypothetical protein
VSDPEALVSGLADDDMESTSGSQIDIADRGDSKEEISSGVDEPLYIDKQLERLQLLYIKLLISLRIAVRIVFPKHRDVLEAGTEIQVFPHLVLSISLHIYVHRE